MSHSKERNEKICLNCNEELTGRYCHKCGQENTEPKESLWTLITHFFHDITHFDGKFFDTLKWLILRPGFLSREYVLGRRARYLNPVRMYVFTSAIFFILFFSFFFSLKDMGFSSDPVDAMIPDVPGNRKSDTSGIDTAQQRHKEISKPVDTVTNSFRWTNPALEKARTKEDSVRVFDDYEEMMRAVDSLNAVEKKESGKKKKGKLNFSYETAQYRSVAHYDSTQNRLPADQKDGWLRRTIKRKNIELEKKFKNDQGAIMQAWVNKFMHSVPQLLFVSLPLVALILQLLYIRRRKEFYFVSHGILLIHIYIYSFINLLVYFSFGKLKSALGWNWIWFIQMLLAVHAFWYVYKAMRNFYRQRRFKTITKFILLNFLTLILITFLFSIFMVLSMWNL